MSSLKPLAYIRDVTGKHIHLGMFESCIGLKTEGTRMTLGIHRVKYTETRASYAITKRGMTLYVFDLTPQGWTLVDTITQWWSSEELVRRLPDRAV
jgi:predicted lipoprotein with Yx(FWY)xxD motif